MYQQLLREEKGSRDNRIAETKKPTSESISNSEDIASTPRNNATLTSLSSEFTYWRIKSAFKIGDNTTKQHYYHSLAEKNYNYVFTRYSKTELIVNSKFARHMLKCEVERASILLVFDRQYH